MTEDEALTKWCPFARVAEARRHENGGITSFLPMSGMPAHNRMDIHGEGGAISEAAACVAGRCMAWRWLYQEGGESLIEAIKRRRSEGDHTLVDAKSYVEDHPEYIRRPAPNSGYCGLAGRP